MQYGYWKVSVIKKHPQQASLRHFLPAILVVGFMLLIVVAPIDYYALNGLIIYSISYFLPVSLESFKLAYRSELKCWPGVFIAIILIHFGFGIGFVVNLICRFLNLKPKFFETLSR
jgi:succinoglycan biosynthesis protein ExoA